MEGADFVFPPVRPPKYGRTGKARARGKGVSQGFFVGRDGERGEEGRQLTIHTRLGHKRVEKGEKLSSSADKSSDI